MKKTIYFAMLFIASISFAQQKDSSLKNLKYAWIGIGGNQEKAGKLSMLFEFKDTSFDMIAGFGLGYTFNSSGTAPSNPNDYISPRLDFWTPSQGTQSGTIFGDIQLLFGSHPFFAGFGYGIGYYDRTDYWYSSASNTYWSNSDDSHSIIRGEWSLLAGLFFEHWGLKFDYNQYRKLGGEILIGFHL